MTSEEPVPLIQLVTQDATSGIERRGRLALARTARDAGLARRILSGFGLTMCEFAPRCVALGLAGTFDRAGRAGLRALMPSLRHLATHELDIDLAGLGEYDAPATRLIGHSRIHWLVGSAPVKVHHYPAWMGSKFSRSRGGAVWIDARDRPAVEPAEA